MRQRQSAPLQGALPPAFGAPRDISTKMKGAGQVLPFIFAINVPAGGSDACHPLIATEPGAQNSSFKNFGPSEARR
jgi:hypothetical protein